MSKIIEFQKKLLSDPAFRTAFAKDPKRVLDEAGVVLPKDVSLPNAIDPKVLDAQVDNVKEGLDALDTSIEEVDFSSGSQVARVIDESVPLRGREIAGARRAHQELVAADGGDVATVAVVGAVVAAVVAVPVAVAGAAERLSTLARPDAGTLRVSAGRAGLTLHAPGGIRVEGLEAAEAVDMIRRFRE